MYIDPGQGQTRDNPLGTIFLCQQKGLITLPICCKFLNNLFDILFYTHFLYKYITAGQGQTTHWEQNLMSTLCPFVTFKKNLLEI